MKVIIDIPEYIYKVCQGHGDPVYGYIAKGTPLPEGAEILTKEAYSDLCMSAAERTEERTKTHACVCISREAAFDEIIWNSDNGMIDAKLAIEALRKLPSVEPERKKGKWESIDGTHLLTRDVYKCSICGEVVSEVHGYNVYKSFPYSHCGAKMEV